MQKQILFVATPVYSDFITRRFHESMLGLIAASFNSPFDLIIQSHPGTFIYENRNVLSEAFFQSPADYLLWIDSDIAFTPAHVGQLLGDCSRGAHVVSGLYRRKQPTLSYDVQLSETQDAQPLLKVEALGAGFLMMNREVITKLRELMPPGKIPASPEARQLWEPFAGMTEDISFCKRWRDTGGHIHVNPLCQVSHIGVYEYSPLMSTRAPERAPSPIEVAPVHQEMSDLLAAEASFQPAQEGQSI